MVFLTSTDLVTFILILAVGVPLVYIVAKLLKLPSQPIEIAEKKKQAILSLTLFVVVFAIAFAILAIYAYVWVRPNLQEDPIYVFRDTIWTTAILIPLVAVAKLTGQNFASLGLSRRNLTKNLSFGFFVSFIFIFILVFLAPSLGGGFAGFSLPAVYSLISLVLIGFGEEIIFRGFIQTRLTAYGGAITGITVSSLLFAFFNFPLGYFCYSGDVLAAFSYALWRFSTGFVFSYMFHRSKNIVPSTIFHALFIWGALLLRLYF